MEKKLLSFEEWRQQDNAGWYLSKESDESVHERYLEYKKSFEIQTKAIEDDFELEI